MSFATEPEGEPSTPLPTTFGGTGASPEQLQTFAGDRGSLPFETRRALVQLLLGPSIDGRRQTRLWPVLLRDEAVLRSRLHELFLDLIVDTDAKIAFTRQVTSDVVDVPVLLRRSALTFLESALLLHLRQQLTHAEAEGDRAVISVEDIRQHLAVFERDDNSDHAKFTKQVTNAIEKAKKLNLIDKLRGSDERFEISPALKLIFPAEEIQALASAYGAGPLPGGGEAPAEENPE